jgi:hypothetical protein
MSFFSHLSLPSAKCSTKNSI